MSDENKNKNEMISLNDIDDIYDEDIAFWNNEITEIDELYTELKEHYDKVKKSSKGSPGSFNFMLTQAENLIKLKETKMKLGKERVNTKKIKTDTKLSILRSRKDEGKDEDKYASIANAMYEKIMQGPSIKEPAVPKMIESESDVDSILDQRAQELEDKENSNKAKEEQLKEEYQKQVQELEELENNTEEIVEEETINIEYKFVTNMDKVVIAVDEDYNEVLGIEIPEEYQNITITMNDNDEIIAVTEYGEIIEIVEF